MIRGMASHRHLADKVSTVLAKLDRGVWVAFVRDAVRKKSQAPEPVAEAPRGLLGRVFG